MKKKTLAMSVAAALGLSAAVTAQADYDLDAPAAGDENVFALETLDSADSITVGTDTYPNVSDDAGTNTQFDITMELGVGISLGEDLFVRYDLDNGYFNDNSALAAAMGNTPANASIAAVQGGNGGASFVIMQVSAAVDILQTYPLDLAIDSLAVADPSSDLNIRARVFETLTQAVTEGDALNDLSSSTIPLVSFASGLTFTSAAQSTGNVADVETDFTEFVTGSATDAISETLAYIGSASVTPDTDTHNAADGTPVALGDMIDSAASEVVISGDIPIATSSNFLGTNAANTCGTSTPVTSNDGLSSYGLSVSNLIARPYLCFEAGGTEAIPESGYTATITFEPAASTKTNQTTSLTGTIGNIQHNGTTVELPYLTTFSDYNQRIVMVNRGSQDAAYSISDFQTESDTTAVAGTAATGTIPAGGSAVVKVSDVVTLTGKTRTAATVNIVAATGNISVATTQVNLADSSTDTIVLQ